MVSEHKGNKTQGFFYNFSFKYKKESPFSQLFRLYYPYSGGNGHSVCILEQYTVTSFTSELTFSTQAQPTCCCKSGPVSTENSGFTAHSMLSITTETAEGQTHTHYLLKRCSNKVCALSSMGFNCRPKDLFYSSMWHENFWYNWTCAFFHGPPDQGLQLELILVFRMMSWWPF